jgi:Flp pilus assembly protein TadG
MRMYESTLLRSIAAGKRRVPSRRRLGALLSFELLFVLPLLVLLLVALVEFVLLINAESKVTLASQEGARAAALGGGYSDVQAAVTHVLGADVANQADISVDFPNGTSNTGDPVQVVVSLPASLLVPNSLCAIGFDVTKITLTQQTTLIIE